MLLVAYIFIQIASFQGLHLAFQLPISLQLPINFPLEFSSDLLFPFCIQLLQPGHLFFQFQVFPLDLCTAFLESRNS
jgi:hypothetical protein